MLKGHADIYLQDAKTGEIVDERHEDNIVTNAVQELLSFNPLGMRNNLTNYLPLATKALGGVLLFPDTLTEDATKYFAKGIWPTGYASNGVDANADPLRGNFNANESYATATGYRLVWDFGTADANGDIACVCLTSDEGGRGFDLSPYQYTNRVSNSASDISFTNNGSTDAGVYAYHDGVFYGHSITNGTAGDPVTLVIKKWAASPSRQPVSRGHSIDLTTSTTIDMSNTHIVSYSNNYKRYVYWDDSGLRIFQTDNLSTNRSGKYYVCTVAWDGTVSEVEIPYGDMENRMENSIFIVRDDWCYIPFKKTVNSVKKVGFYAVQLSNTSNVRELESEITGYEYDADGYNHGAFVYTDQCNAVVKISLTNYITNGWIVSVLNDGKIIKEWKTGNSAQGSIFTSGSGVIFGLIGPYQLVDGSSSSKILHNKSTYLATINNLGTPITKTADRTLKIIYTLTES